MSSRNDIGRFAIPLVLTALILLSSLFYLQPSASGTLGFSFAGQYFRIGWILDSPLLSQIVSLLLLAVFPFMFFVLDRYYPLKLDISMPLLYAVLVFACKDALSLSPVHMACFFLTWSVYASFRAALETYDINWPFISMLLLSIASLFYVPLIWMAPLMAFMDNNNSAFKGKTVVGSICGLLLPMLFITAISAIASGFKDITGPLMNYLGMAVATDSGIPQIIQVSTMAKVLVLTIAIAWASISFAVTFNTLDIASARCFIRCAIYGLLLVVTALVFGYSAGSLPWIPALTLLSLFLYSFFNRTDQRRSGSFLLVILMLLTLAERIVTLL